MPYHDLTGLSRFPVVLSITERTSEYLMWQSRWALSISLEDSWLEQRP